jgi:antitoxin ParD1/3/4
MTTLNIPVSDSMRTFIDQRVAEKGFGTASEYIRHLVCEEQKRPAEGRTEESGDAAAILEQDQP